MGFRMEFSNGNGRPRFWEVSCDYCEMVGHFPIAEYPDFPAAFWEALRLGWDVNQGPRGTRYTCPTCTGATRVEPAEGGEDGETILPS